MKRAMTLTEARANLLEVAEQFERPTAEAVSVTKRGKPVMTLVPTAAYEALLETLEILADESAVEGIRQGLVDLDSGRTVPWEKAKKRLGL